MRNRPLEGLAWFDSIDLSDLDAGVSAAVRARSLADSAVLGAFTVDAQMIDKAEEALAIARELDDPVLLARTLTSCIAAAAFNVGSALPYIAEALDVAREQGDRWRLSQILAWNSYTACLAGDPVATAAAGEEGEAHAQASGDRFIARMCRYWGRGVASFQQGDLTGSIAVLSDLLVEADAAGDVFHGLLARIALAHAMLHRGDIAEARKLSAEAVEVGSVLGPFVEMWALAPLAQTALAMGDVAQNLVRLFFLMEDSKKDPYAAKPLEVREVGVLGAGVMGGGIAQIIVDKSGADVRMRDINWKAISGGFKAASKVWKKKVERRRMTRGEMARKLARITGTTDWSGYSRTDLVIEAVVENIQIKRQVLAEFESLAKPAAIFATNTSTIPITQIAAEAKHPENVAGMHFFNPVDKMPLVEVIRGEKSSDAAIVTVANFARKLGKTVVYCNDGPGFVVNRILGPYMNEAGFLLEEGNSIESIDKAMLDFGMPMGPMALLDEVGLDVAAKVGVILGEAFGSRMQERSVVVDKLYADGRLGKKGGRGLYVYEGGKRQGPDASVYKIIGVRSPKPADAKAVVERTILAMVNEASLILAEKIVASAGELDLAMIMGTGFPPFRGGLLRYADSLGLPYIQARLDELSSRLGPRFKPNEPLKRLAERDGKFYQAYARS